MAKCVRLLLDIVYFTVLHLSTDHYLQDSKKNERTAHSHFHKGPGYEVLVAYTT